MASADLMGGQQLGAESLDASMLPGKQKSIDGYRYGLVFVDHYSGFINVYAIRRKNDVPSYLNQWLADMAPAGARELQTFLSDAGTGEYMNKDVNDILQGLATEKRWSVNNPSGNARAELAIQELIPKARALLKQSGLPRTMWSYAFIAAATVATLKLWHRRRGKC